MADDKKKPERDHVADAVTEWAPMINMHVTKLRRQGIPQSVDDTDLHTAGIHGLMDAFHRYDSKKGNFNAFASKRIFGKMMDHVTSSHDVNSVDKLHRDKARQMKPKKP